MGKSSSTTYTETGPWKPAQGALQGILGQAQDLGTSGRFAPNYSNQTRDSLDMMERVARSGSNATVDAMGPLVARSGQGYQTGFDTLNATARGDMLNNPYVNDYLRRSNELVADRVNAQFSGAGRYGGAGAHTGALTDALARNTTGVMMDQYNRERGNQMTAANVLHGAGFQGAAMAPQLDQARLYNAGLLGQVGSQREAMDMAERQAPLRALDWQRGVVAPIGAMGQSGQTTQETQPNRFSQVMGGAMMGAGLINPIGRMFSGMGPLISSVPGSAANGGWQTNTYGAWPWAT